MQLSQLTVPVPADCKPTGGQSVAATYAVAQAAVTSAYTASYSILYYSADVAYSSVAVSTAAAYVSWSASVTASAAQAQGAASVSKAVGFAANNAVSCVRATTFSQAQASSASFANSSVYTNAIANAYSFATASASSVVQVVVQAAPSIGYFNGNTQIFGALNGLTKVMPPTGMLLEHYLFSTFS